MSRTQKDKPYRVLKDQEPWRFERGYPGIHSGAWNRIGRFTRDWWKSERAKERQALIRNEEPEPTRTRSSVKYSIW